MELIVYRKSYHGTAEAVEAAIKTFDRVLKLRYNTYGGKRLSTWRDSNGEYAVAMEYRLGWTQPRTYMGRLFPEYTPEGVDRTFYRWMARHPLADDFDSSPLM